MVELILSKESASTAGSGDVSNSQPSIFAGDVASSTEGSGDIPFYLLRKGKRKKGNPSEVSDLRDLEEVDVEEVDDLKESKIFENSNIQYNWIILNLDDHYRFISFIFCEDMDMVYEKLRNLIFKSEDDEITYTNIPYNEFKSFTETLLIYRIDSKVTFDNNKADFEIHSLSDDCWNDFLNFYNNTPLNENKNNLSKNENI